MALLVLADPALRTRDLEAFYSAFGILPRGARRALVGVHEDRGSLHRVAGSVACPALLFAPAAACAVALLLGWRTRSVSLLSWVLRVTLHTRNHLMNLGGDIGLRRLLLLPEWLPVLRWIALQVERCA